jgi:hypothetical protein
MTGDYGNLARKAIRARGEMRHASERLHELLGDDPELLWFLDALDWVNAATDRAMAAVLKRPDDEAT